MLTACHETKRWLLRLFAGSWSAMCILAAWLLAKGFPGSSVWGWPLAAAAAFAVGLIFPEAMQRPYRLVERVFKPVGELFALVVLAVVYFGIFTPFAVLLKLVRWDPLRLHRQEPESSAWMARNPAPVEANYHWQY